MKLPDSSTMVRSSSVDSRWSRAPFVLMCSTRRMPVANKLTNQISGLATRINGAISRLAGSAIFSGNVAPTIFGVISANTIMRNATIPVAIDSTRLLRPNVCSASDVVSTGMIVLNRLLPMRITLSS